MWLPHTPPIREEIPLGEYEAKIFINIHTAREAQVTKITRNVQLVDAESVLIFVLDQDDEWDEANFIKHWKIKEKKNV